MGAYYPSDDADPRWGVTPNLSNDWKTAVKDTFAWFSSKAHAELFCATVNNSLAIWDLNNAVKIA